VFRHFDSPSTGSGQAAQCDIRLECTLFYLNELIINFIRCPPESRTCGTQCDIRVRSALILIIALTINNLQCHTELEVKNLFEQNDEMTGVNSILIHFQKVRKHFSTLM